MQTEAVIYQSSVTSDGQPAQQISNLSLTGIVTIADSLNNDNGKLYGSFSYSAPTYTLSLYSDITKDNLVAQATATAMGTATVSPQNDSGISGTVNFVQYLQNDTLIEAVCCLTTDSDIPLANANAFSDYDPTYGFANYHILAFEKVKEIIRSRYRSILYSRTLVDSKQINGGLGGFDLSKVLSWEPVKEAASYYVLAKLAERQYVEAGGVWDKRSKEAFGQFRAHMTTVELAFDLNQQRVADKTRVFSTFKIGRS